MTMKIKSLPKEGSRVPIHLFSWLCPISEVLKHAHLLKLPLKEPSLKTCKLRMILQGGELDRMLQKAGQPVWVLVYAESWASSICEITVKISRPPFSFL